MIFRLRSLFGRPAQPIHPLVAANNAFFRTFSHEKPLASYDFVVIDTELTGLNPNKDEIVAIGAVRIRNQRIVSDETFYALVKPRERLQSRSTLVHRITPQELLLAEPLEEVLPRFLEFCGTAFVVGHYVRMDLDFINRATENQMGGVLKTPYLCTLRLAMAYNEAIHGHYYDHYNVQGAYNLASLSKEFNLPLFPDHNALHDAFQAAYLFLFLTKKMNAYSFRTFADFLKAGRSWKILL